MSDSALISRLVGDIRLMYASDPLHARQLIDSHLKTELSHLPVDQSRNVIQSVMAHFVSSEPNQCPETVADKELLTRVFGLLLGRKVSMADLSSNELLERLAQSLNTIFNALNQLISVINATLSSGTDKGEQTIRQVIGFHLEGDEQAQSLEAYLGQINAAFLTTQEAFKKAAHAKVSQIIHAIDTDKIAAERSNRLKIGPLRKAEDFDILKEKIDRIKRWFDSGRFMEDFLREFEKNCREINRA
ncbi:MAG: hypothetical protein M0036_09630 [Desulfobacteraceae bacterium]|nr:hypothetical protein [Desulfobacteraceae bacterium]